MPSRLVDTFDLKIVTVSRGTRRPYFALSYVWGTDPNPTLRRDNFSAFHSRKGLQDPAVRLPRTILDAMEITRSFGYRFIWIDALCIVQSDDEDKMREIAIMHEIYANAKV
jgi:Heterokaryon incompatibility protein (HET)